MAGPYNDRLDRIGDYPFDRLRALLGPLAPAADVEPIMLSLGEPQHTAPDMIRTTVEATAELWGKYPPMRGTPEFRAAVGDWLTMRYRLPAGMIDADRNILPLSGTREGLFLVALAAVPESKAGKRPAVLMPNPFYQVYVGAAVLAGAEPVLVPATRENGFLPDFAALSSEVLERTAFAYLCSPANPQGAVASLEALTAAVALARRYDFLLVADECYSEIWLDAPPPGAVEACAALGGTLDNVAVFQSLSKRSSAPGLRSGFVAANAAFTDKFARLRDYGGVAPPLPLLAAATALWRDEAHVAASRELYRRKFDMAEAALGGRHGFYRPGGGFYLWLDVGDGEDAARRLWREAALRVLPGAYLARPDADGVNPGARYIRCALVHDLATTAEALARLARVLRERGMAGFFGGALRTSLPWDRLAVFIRRRLEELAGLGCVTLAGAVFVALATYNPGDPSFTFAAPGTPRNWLGPFGARLSDVLYQTVGLGAWIVGLALLAWGWRLASHHGLGRVWLKLAVLAAGLLLAAVALAALGTPEAWSVPTGLGGLAGKLLHDRLGALLTALGGAGLVGWLGLAAAVPAAAALFFALGLGPSDWRGIGRAIAWSGRLTGRAGAWSGRLGVAAGRGLTGRFRRERAAAPARPRERVEPRLAGAARRTERAAEPARPRQPAPPEQATREAHGRDESGLVAVPRRRTASGKRPESARQASLALDHDGYALPPLDLLDPPPDDEGDDGQNDEALAQNARLLESVLDDFGVRGEIVKVRPGPVVTLYELEPAPGTKSSRVIGLADDIARSMSAVSVRVAVIPGRTVIGIELPNSRREVISLRDILSSEPYERATGRLTLALGKDIGGTPVIADLARMPHLLIAGTTGSGKSVAINSMILSLLYRLPPEQCRFIMIDPKMLELSVYDGIPHLLAPVVTDPGKAVVALRWAVREMENRYRSMSQLGVRNIAGYNARLEEARKAGETLMRTVQTGFHAETGEPIYEKQPLDMNPLPLIVVIVDEMADLMLVAGKDVEAAVQRLSQMARAAGIHLIMATQRPSVDVITGTIKANFPTRISFQVTSKIDSRTILGESGAEQLLGQGDMLHMSGGGRIMRVHGPFVTDEEVERVVAALRDQGEPDYDDSITDGDDTRGFPGLGGSGGGGGGEDDQLYDQAVALVCRERKASTSFIQRYLQIGYNRAARIMERMEAEGVVSPANGVGKREVLGRDIDDRER